MSRLMIGLLWLLHFLPLALLAPLGTALGRLLYLVARSRRRVVLTNLRLCFPALDDDERSLYESGRREEPCRLERQPQVLS